MAEEEQQEKTEEPTSRRKRKARNEGKVAKSEEVTNAFFLLTALVVFKTIGGFLMSKMKIYSTESLLNLDFVLKPSNMPQLFFTIFSPVAAILIVVTFIASIIQVGWMWTTKNIKLQLNKAIQFSNPFSKVFKPEGIKNLAKSLLKVIILGFISYLVLKNDIPFLMNLIDMNVQQIFSYVADLVLKLLFYILIFYIAFAAADFIITKLLHHKKMKMSKSEVKDERKQMEGDPEIRSKLRTLMMEESRKRMMEEVPDADVVITNPIHLAVALKYDSDKFDAPFVVAKGKRLIAEKIKEIAREHNIPIIEDKPLARMLYKTSEVGQEIVPDLYSAVAEIIAQVYKMKNKKMS